MLKSSKGLGVEREARVLHWSLFLSHHGKLETGIESKWAKSSDPETKFRLYRSGFWFRPWLCWLFGDQYGDQRSCPYFSGSGPKPNLSSTLMLLQPSQSLCNLLHINPTILLSTSLSFD